MTHSHDSLVWLISNLKFQPSASLNHHHKHSMSPSCGSGSVQGGHSHGSEFKCEICGKCFKHVRMLNRHRRNHSPYKKYKCAYCNKGFNDSFDLKRHVRTHTGLLSKNHQKIINIHRNIFHFQLFSFKNDHFYDTIGHFWVKRFGMLPTHRHLMSHYRFF